VPVDGPSALPREHVLVPGHQPHRPRAAQLAQSVPVEQSIGIVHSEVTQRQSVQVPVVGPLPLPFMQVLVSPHQPQGPIGVQVSHIVALAQSAPPPTAAAAPASTPPSARAPPSPGGPASVRTPPESIGTLPPSVGGRASSSPQPASPSITSEEIRIVE